jgi:hypothetical protein
MHLHPEHVIDKCRRGVTLLTIPFVMGFVLQAMVIQDENRKYLS